MSARRHRIVMEVAARLGALPGVAVEVMPAGDPDRLPALGVIDQGQRAVDRDPYAVRYELDLLLDGHVDGDGGPAALAALNGLYAAAVRALMADPTLGGLAVLVQEGDMAVETVELAERRALRFYLGVRVLYNGAAHDPEV